MSLSSLPLTAASEDGSLLAALSEEQQERLSIALEAYLRALEAGEPPPVDALCAEHPDLAAPLQLYIQSLQQLHHAAIGFTPPEPRAIHGEQCLGDFVLGREIGRGGMGVVYEARQLSLDRRVAVKVLPFASVLGPKQIARFKNEAQAAAQLNHPHIVPVYAVGEDHGLHFYAMQLIEGQSLDQALAEVRHRDRRPPRTNPLVASQTRQGNYYRAIAELGAQAAEALHAAHEQGIIHRDIKPSNMLVDAAGHLWVADFGLARSRHNVALTMSGDIMGTLRYMSPEQALGRTSLVDPRTDIYSLGASLYELATLRPAFDDENQVSLLRRLEQQEPLRPSLARRGVPLNLEAVILKAMAKNREERYETAAELAADLRRVMRNEPTVARPPQTIDRVVRWVRRYQLPVWAGSVLTACALAAIATACLMIGDARRQTTASRAEAHKQRRQTIAAVDRLDVFADRLLELPAAEDLRQRTLEESLAFYRGLASEAAPQDQAALQLKIGELCEQLGRLDEAIAAYRESVASIQRRTSNDEATVRTASALSKTALGRALVQRGETKEAIRLLSAAANEWEQLSRAEDGKLYAAQLASCYLALGKAHLDTPASDQAARSLKSAVELYERALAEADHEPRMVQGWCEAVICLSQTQLATSPQRSVELLERSLQELPNASRHAAQHAELLSALGAAQRAAGELDASAKSLSAAIEEERQLVETFPKRLSYQRALAASQGALGLVRMAQGNASEAEEQFSAAATIHSQLAAAFPQDVELHSELGCSYNNLGIAQRKQSKLADAAESFAMAVKEQQQAHGAADGRPRYRLLLSKHLANQADALAAIGRFDEALAAIEARRLLWPSASERLLGIAEDLSRLYAVMQSSNADEAALERCRQSAIETLRAAKAAGAEIPKQLVANPVFSFPPSVASAPL
jgi:tetratricopeptide (TPR) repeat protein